MGTRNKKYLKALTSAERNIFTNNIENMLTSHHYIGDEILLGVFYYLIGIGSSFSLNEQYFLPMGFFTNISENEVLTALERLEKGKDDRDFFSIGFKFAHDFISSGKENVEIANESLKRITEALNERVERANYIYKKEVRDYILLDLRRITVEFLRKAVNI